MPDQKDIEPDSDLPAESDPAVGVGDTEPLSDLAGQGPDSHEDPDPPSPLQVRSTETSRRVELVETISHKLSPDGQEETTRTTQVEETVRRTAVPHQAPGSAYPAPVG